MYTKTTATIKISLRSLRLLSVAALSFGLLLIAYAYAQGKNVATVKATVAGWYDARPVDSLNLAVSSNMSVWVNGHKFVRCDNPSQPFEPSYYQSNSPIITY